MKRSEVTYGQLDKVLRSLGFSCRVVQKEPVTRVYEHKKTGALLMMPPFPETDFVLVVEPLLIVGAREAVQHPACEASSRGAAVPLHVRAGERGVHPGTKLPEPMTHQLLKSRRDQLASFEIGTIGKCQAAQIINPQQSGIDFQFAVDEFLGQTRG